MEEEEGGGRRRREEEEGGGGEEKREREGERRGREWNHLPVLLTCTCKTCTIH